MPDRTDELRAIAAAIHDQLDALAAAAAAGERDPLRKFAQAPPFGPLELESIRLTGHQVQARLRCSCGLEWSGRVCVNAAATHVVISSRPDGRHVVEAQWVHSFRIASGRRGWNW